jgi:hypothetical protein
VRDVGAEMQKIAFQVERQGSVWEELLLSFMKTHKSTMNRKDNELWISNMQERVSSIESNLLASVKLLRTPDSADVSSPSSFVPI